MLLIVWPWTIISSLLFIKAALTILSQKSFNNTGDKTPYLTPHWILTCSDFVSWTLTMTVWFKCKFEIKQTSFLSKLSSVLRASIFCPRYLLSFRWQFSVALVFYSLDTLAPMSLLESVLVDIVYLFFFPLFRNP